MKTAGIIKALCTFTLILVPVVSHAQTDSQPSPKLHHMWADLGLTDDQKVKLKELHQEIKTVRSKNFEAVRTVRTKIKEELTKQNPSNPQLDAYASELGNLHKDMVQQHNNHLLKVKNVLSAEQFSKLVSRDGDAFGKRHMKKGKNGASGAQYKKSSISDQKNCSTGRVPPGCAHTVE